MKLIDAEHLKRWLTTRWLESDPTSDKPIKMADILNQINYGEFSIDLVRCGECKWWDRDGDRPFGYCHAEKHCYFSTNWEISIFRTYKSDHFCSDGERRADETQP